MVAPLRRVAVASPARCGWRGEGRRWGELGFLHPPDVARAERQHELLVRLLERAGVEVVELPGADGLTPDAVYVHDASLPTDGGAILLRPGKASRRGETAAHEGLYRELGVPILGRVREPGTVEAGDLVWLDPDTVLAGRGLRTDPEGLRRLAGQLAPLGVELREAPLPWGEGPSACLHLMSLLSLVGPRTALVDLPSLAVSTVELLRRRDFRLVEIEPAERATLAANVLALGEGVVVALAENRKTNRRLEEAGFEVRTFPGSEIGIVGQGGPTCLTRPLWRELRAGPAAGGATPAG